MLLWVEQCRSQFFNWCVRLRRRQGQWVLLWVEQCRSQFFNWCVRLRRGQGQWLLLWVEQCRSQDTVLKKKLMCTTKKGAGSVVAIMGWTVQFTGHSSLTGVYNWEGGRVSGCCCGLNSASHSSLIDVYDWEEGRGSGCYCGLNSAIHRSFLLSLPLLSTPCPNSVSLISDLWHCPLLLLYQPPSPFPYKYYHETVYHAKKLVQGHNEGLYKHNLNISTISSTLLSPPAHLHVLGMLQFMSLIEVAHSFLSCSHVYFHLYGPFNCISLHKFSPQLYAFSLCAFSLISALLVLSTVYLFKKVSLSPDIILCGWLNQLNN